MNSMTICAETILDRISELARKHSHSIALSDGTRTLSYKRLEAQTDRFAAYLRNLEVGQGNTVVLCMERSFEWIVAALGIMKAGAAYVPLDPAWPDSRVRFALTDSDARAFVGPKERFDRLDTAIRSVDPVRDEESLAVQHRDFEILVTPASLAYIVYTSGSTGVPKGVEITHANLNHLVRWHRKTFNLTSRDRTSHLAGLGFDAAVWEIWPSLCAGATLCLAADSVRLSADTIQRWMLQERITVGFVPTVYAAPMMAMRWPAQTELRFLLTGGDALHNGSQNGLPFRVVNNYGPAECTVVSTSHVLAPGDQGVPPIGRAIEGATVHLLGEDRQPVEDGAVGEIFVGGNGVGRGYRNLPDATKHAFLPNPFVNEPGARMYRTGDLAVRRPDGALEFRGRIDRQVKIRGQRVELDEITNALARHPSIAFAIVTTRGSLEDSIHLIVHFLPSDKSNVPTGPEFRSYLRTTLPEYMIPSIFVQLETLPLSENGKIDLSRLPDFSSSEQSVDPRADKLATPTEKMLMQIVQDLLGGQSISEDDNLFLCGGHSLFGMQLLTRVGAAFGVDLSLQQLFDAPTVSSLASVIDRTQLHPQEERRNRALDLPEAPGCSGPCTSSFSSFAHDKNQDRPIGSCRAGLAIAPRIPAGARTQLTAETTVDELKEDMDQFFGVLALHREGRRMPIFWVHNLVISLARELGGDQPFFIVMLTSAEQKGLGPSPSLHDIAALFLKKISAIQPDGPFILGGLCIGSVLVYEIAQQMRASGLEVKLLILLDAPTQPYLSACATLAAKFGHPGYAIERARRIGLRKTLQNIGKRLIQSIPFTPRFNHFQSNWEMVHEMVVNAAFAYDPQPYDGEVLLLLSANPPRHLDFLPGWRAVVGSKLKIAYVDGHHRDFITADNVRAITQTIAQSIPDSTGLSSSVLEDLANSAITQGSGEMLLDSLTWIKELLSVVAEQNALESREGGLIK